MNPNKGILIAMGKLLLFGAIIAIFITAVKTISRDPDQQERSNRGNIERHASLNDSAIYFIGSSRVQNSIDPVQIESCIDGASIENMGIAGANLLPNAIMTYYLLSEHSPKMILMELGNLDLKNHEVFETVTHSLGMNARGIAMELLKTNDRLQRYQYQLSSWNNNTFNQLSLRDDLKRLMGSKQNHTKQPPIGHYKRTGSTFNSAATMITYEQLTTPVNLDVSDHLTLLTHLQQMANQKGVPLKFFIPTTFDEFEERDISISVHQQLPVDWRIEFDSIFLNKMAKPQFMFDNIHLNETGTVIYSEMICQWLSDNR